MKARKVDSGAVAHSEPQASGEVQNTAPLSTRRRPFDLSAILSRTSAEVNAVRRAVPKHEIPTRMAEKAENRVDDKKEEKRWRKEIWTRDKSACRWCRRKVVKAMDLLPERGECHHVVPRENRVTRWDSRAALLVCHACHERLTGKVGGERFVVVASKTFTVDLVQYPDCRRKVSFKRIDKVQE